MKRSRAYEDLVTLENQKRTKMVLAVEVSSRSRPNPSASLPEEPSQRTDGPALPQVSPHISEPDDDPMDGANDDITTDETMPYKPSFQGSVTMDGSKNSPDTIDHIYLERFDSHRQWTHDRLD